MTCFICKSEKSAEVMRWMQMVYPLCTKCAQYQRCVYGIDTKHFSPIHKKGTKPTPTGPFCPDTDKHAS